MVCNHYHAIVLFCILQTCPARPAVRAKNPIFRIGSDFDSILYFLNLNS